GEVWDEVTVHHVDLDAIGAGLLCLLDLLRQSTDVGGEDRRDNLNPRHQSLRHSGTNGRVWARIAPFEPNWSVRSGISDLFDLIDPRRLGRSAIVRSESSRMGIRLAGQAPPPRPCPSRSPGSAPAPHRETLRA